MMPLELSRRMDQGQGPVAHLSCRVIACTSYGLVKRTGHAVILIGFLLSFLLWCLSQQHSHPDRPHPREQVWGWVVVELAYMVGPACACSVMHASASSGRPGREASLPNYHTPSICPSSIDFGPGFYA